MNNKSAYTGIDSFRLIAVILVIAIHTSPLTVVNGTANFILTRIVARVAVPFFIMTSGFFLFRHGADTRRLSSFLKKTGSLYIVAILLYLPINLYNGSAEKWLFLPNLLRSTFLDGTFYHIWYLPAVMLGAVIVWCLLRSIGRHGALAISILFYIIGLLGDSYYGFAVKVPALKAIYETMFTFFGYTRNGLFFAPLFLVLGAHAAEPSKGMGLTAHLTGLGISFALLLAEGLWLRTNSLQRHDSMYIALPLCMVFMFNILLLWNSRGGKQTRFVSTIIYVIHPMMIICVRGVSELIDAPLLVNNSVVFFITVTVCSLLAGVLIKSIPRKEKPLLSPVRQACTDRAWAQINLDHLRHNAAVLQLLLPDKCSIMAVVKANAYGHGDIEVAHALNNIGIRAFAVATIEEGIRLRQNGIRGDILVLGYTDPQRAAALSRYRLCQTVADARHAAAFSSPGQPVHVHIKVDTGMHRLGESCENAAQIAEIFSNNHLAVDGIFTHLCASDSMEPADMNLTALQMNRFFGLLDELNKDGIRIPKCHILSSYGALNYSQTPSDYARIGLAIYGAVAQSHMKRIGLKPVLSLKARVVLIRMAIRGESIGYGRSYIAQRDTRVAVLPIGYADGLPRSLGNDHGCVLLHGRRAPIIGSVCMDQLMVDVTDNPGVQCGDIATLIGQDGEEEIFAENVAETAGTITNEILSRLGARLQRIYISL